MIFPFAQALPQLGKALSFHLLQLPRLPGLRQIVICPILWHRWGLAASENSNLFLDHGSQNSPLLADQNSSSGTILNAIFSLQNRVHYPIPTAMDNHQTLLCVYGFAYSGYFLQLKFNSTWSLQVASFSKHNILRVYTYRSLQ